MQPSRITAELGPQQLTLYFAGRFDTVCSTAMQPQIQDHVQSALGHKIVFDLSQVDFVSSMFLRLCIMTAKSVGTGNFQVTHASSAVRDIFAIAGLERHFGML